MGSLTTLLRIGVGTLCVIAAGTSWAASPNLSSAPPIESFIGETFCFDNTLTNSGTPGFGPYLRFTSDPELDVASANFVGLALSPITVGTFPAAPGNELTDPITGTTVSGIPGQTLTVVRYPVGSVVTGAPPLTMELCVDVATGATENILLPDALTVQPIYEFGDTATGTNGPIEGTQSRSDFTPRIIEYRLENMTAEGERPPGPEWAWDINVIADIANARTVSPIDFNTVSPITLPPNVQFLGPVSFSGGGVNCTATTPATPPPENPGGTIALNCTSGTGTNGNDEDIVATFPVYIVDTLDENVCTNDSAINTAKHVTIQKGNGGGGLPGALVTFTIDIDVSEFVDGVDRLIITDTLPDGLTYIDAPTVSYEGAGAVPVNRTVSLDAPGTGQTTVVYDVTTTVGTLAAASTATISYQATIDQSYSGSPFTGQPLRARDTLTNTVTGDYDLLNGANNCSDDSASSLTIQDISISKEIVGSSNVQPGETVTWRLRLDIPSGDLQGISFTDFFPLPTFDATTVDTSTNLAANPDVAFGPNNTLAVNPSAISANAGENSLTLQWPDVSSTNGEVLEIDVSIDAGTEPFADGLTLSNLYQVASSNSPSDNRTELTIDSVTLQQPDLSIDKVATSAATNLGAGSVVTYAITVTNDGSAEAYDLVVTDSPDAGLSCTQGAVTGGTGAGDVFAGGFTFSGFNGATPTALDPGDSVTINTSCTLADTVENNTTYRNTASSTFASQPGAPTFPVITDEATARTAQVQASKSLIATSEATTPEGTADTSGDPRLVVTGEIVRYRMITELPQGVIPNLRVRDLLPIGLEYIPGNQTLLGLVSDGGTDLSAAGLACAAGTPNRSGNETTDLDALALDCVVSPSSGGGSSGADVFFSLGNVTNDQRDANDELLVIEFNARVVGDIDRGTNMGNRSQALTDNGNRLSGLVVAQQAEPEISITKTASPAAVDADDAVEYIIVFEHSGDSNAVAFDVGFTDVIPAGLTYNAGAGVTGPVAPAAPGGDTCTTNGITTDDSDPAGAGITITFDELGLGDRCEVRFSATTSGSVAPGQIITNQADLDYDTLPGSGNRREPHRFTTGSAGDLYQQRDSRSDHRKR